jgi:dCTP deaminase
MILDDKRLAQLGKSQELMIPFEFNSVSSKNGNKVISYGLGSYGYDIRLSPKEFYLFVDKERANDPKEFKQDAVINLELKKDVNGEYFIMPPHSYGLGVSLELFNMPNNVTGICMGKSTYARVGIVANITPLEAGWSGYLTLEFANTSNAPCRLYANEGIAQVIFFEGENCLTSYAFRQGKYQNQPQQVVFAK